MTEVQQVQGTHDKIDAGHWVSNCGGGVMVVVMILCMVGIAAPWWTLEEETDTKLLIEVSLWTRYARMETVSTGASLDCETMCDITNVGSTTVREVKEHWLTICKDKDVTDDVSSACSPLWTTRVCALVALCFALFYSVVSVLAFCGSGKPAACRFPPAFPILFSLGCILALPIALIVAGSIDIKIEPPTPGSGIRDRAIPMKSIDMNGPGFICTLISIFVSVVGLGFACLNQSVMDHLHSHWEFENGRPMADGTLAEAPIHGELKPPTKKLNAWTTEPGGP